MGNHNRIKLKPIWISWSRFQWSSQGILEYREYMVHIALYLSGRTIFLPILNAVSSYLEERTVRLLLMWRNDPWVFCGFHHSISDTEKAHIDWGLVRGVLPRFLDFKLKIYFALLLLYFLNKIWLFFSFLLNCLYSNCSTFKYYVRYDSKTVRWQLLWFVCHFSTQMLI